ncbi:(Fe-S)-binding protein [Micromonospora haikouensis]|uniref:(Fe-S)-binding protein n=1 Tax=Micromonospora TaxID=1873 RepID=UPI001E53F831|nr:(Fe-S)-binding protein [Micromonospora sp. NBRC 110038]
MALFVTCLVDGLVPRVGAATVAVLERLGLDVAVPRRQTCCGQLHVNSGYPDQALALVRNHVAAFADAEAVVVASGSCVAAIRHQHVELARAAGDEGLAAEAAAVAARTYELSEFLVDVRGVLDVGAWFPHRVTLHQACHALRLLRTGDRARRLLDRVEGIELVDLPDADSCCGFGGTFALKNASVSAAMLADKLRAVDATGATVVTAGDASCLTHLGGGLSRAAARARTVHLAEILAATRDRPWAPPGAPPHPRRRP